jgi:hypothetical protein
MTKSLGNRPRRQRDGALLALAAASLGLSIEASAADTHRLVADCQLLLRRGVGVGLILSDMNQMRMFPQTATPLESSGEEGDPRALIEAMRKRWSPQFEVSEAGDGVNVIAAGASRCRKAMAIRRKADSYRGTPIEVLFQLATRLDPSLRGLRPPGFVWGGFPGSIPDPEKDVLRQPFAVDTNEGSLIEVLGEITKAAPTLGWYAAERCENGGCRCELGVLTPHAEVWAGYDASASLPKKER